MKSAYASGNEITIYIPDNFRCCFSPKVILSFYTDNLINVERKSSNIYQLNDLVSDYVSKFCFSFKVQSPHDLAAQDINIQSSLIYFAKDNKRIQYIYFILLVIIFSCKFFLASH